MSRAVQNAKTWRWVVLPCLLIVGGWWLVTYFAARNGAAAYSRNWQENIFLITFGGVSLAGLLVDFICLALAGAAISSDIEAGRWTLLCLTSLSDKSLVSAKHAGIRLRCWRWLQVVVGLRCGVVAILVVEFLDFLNVSSPEVFWGIVVFLAFAPYVTEPFWRTQAMTTVGLFISALNRSTTQTLLIAVFGLLALCLAQALIVGPVTYVILRGLMMIYDALPSAYYMWLDYIFPGLLVACFWLLNYGFYDLLERLSWKHTLRRLSQLDI